LEQAPAFNINENFANKPMLRPAASGFVLLRRTRRRAGNSIHNSTLNIQHSTLNKPCKHNPEVAVVAG
jgi:hypothetical protein